MTPGGMTRGDALGGLELLFAAVSRTQRDCDAVDVCRLAESFQRLPKPCFMQLTVADVVRVLIEFEPDGRG